MPAPDYFMHRYTDWVLPYLANESEKAQKYMNAVGTEEKLKTIASVSSLFEVY